MHRSYIQEIVSDLRPGDTKVVATKSAECADDIGRNIHQVMDKDTPKCSYQYLNLHRLGEAGLRIWRNS